MTTSPFAHRRPALPRPHLRLVRGSDEGPPHANVTRTTAHAPLAEAGPGTELAGFRDERDFAALHRRLVAPLSAFARSLVDAGEVADVVQEAFVRYWRRTATARRLVVPRSPERFLMVLVRDVANEVLRTEARRAAALGRGAAADGPRVASAVPFPLGAEGRESAAPDTRAERLELGRAIAAAADELPDRLYEVFRMKYDEGLTTAEIAEELALEESTVRANLARALEALRGPLAARGHWPASMSTGEAAAIARREGRR